MKIQVYIELNKNKAIKEYQSKYSIKMSYWNIKETMHMIYPGKWLLEIYQTIKIFLKIRNQLFRNRIYNIKHCLIRINCIAMKNRLNNKNKHKEEANADNNRCVHWKIRFMFFSSLKYQ